MKKWSWIVFVLTMAVACLDEPDCLPAGEPTLVIAFKNVFDGKADTVILYNIEAAGADSIFYKTAEPDELDTLFNGIVEVSVNPFENETAFTFNFELLQRTLTVGYKHEAHFISEECGSDYIQYDLSVLETEFDSIRVVNSVLSKNRTPNIEIYR